jgi:hypothetical protein
MMRAWVVCALVAVAACAQHTHDTHANDPMPDAGTTTSPFACSVDTAGACASAAQYCYIGELAVGTYYPASLEVREGCNALPTNCTGCGCLIRPFAAGFCTCDTLSGGLTVRCSLD